MRNNEEHIKQLMERIRGQKSLKDRLTREAVRQALKSIFGEVALAYVRDVHVRNKVLTLYISSSTFRHELQMSLDQLKEKLNKVLDGPKIEQIILR
jgi:hypothetical protein